MRRGGASGATASVEDQVSRRVPKTAVAVVETVPSCDSSIDQCWVDRLVRTGRATISNSP